MATTVQILTSNYSGETAQITFFPCSGGSIDLGNHVLPYNHISYDDNYLGEYLLYFNNNETCTFSIPCPTATPLPTSTPTPTSTPEPTATPTPTPCPPAGTLLYTFCDGVDLREMYSGGPASNCGTYSVVIEYNSISCGGSGPTPTDTPTPTPTPPTDTPTPTPTPIPLFTYTGSGYGNTPSEVCFDASENGGRTLYSECDTFEFGINCIVFEFSNPLTGYNYVQMNGQTWNINSSTGQITGLATLQC
jgi:hypothetical protein